MLRKFCPITTLILFLLLFSFCPVDNARADTNELDLISARSYILMDADSGKVLKARNAHLRLPPASMTKMMTILLALEAIEQGKAHKTDRIITSQHAASMEGTRIYLEQGEVMCLDDLLKAMTLASANDASVAVAEKLGGSEPKFVQQMNRKAGELGMKDSSFKNVSGMPANGHYSSAYDMAVLARYTIATTPIIDYSSLKQYSLRDGEFPIYNGNKLLWRYNGADGLKNGYTSGAKNCLTATAKRGKLRLIVVVMGCPLKGGQTKDATALLNYGFEHYAAVGLLPKDKICATVKVKHGTSQAVQALVPADVTAIYKKSQGAFFTRRQNLVESIEAPVKRGQKLGEMQILNDGKLLKKMDLVAANDVPRMSWFGRILGIPWWLKVLIVLVLGLHYVRRRLRRNGGHWKRPQPPKRGYYDY